MPMGLRSAALICQRLTNAVTFIYRKRGWCVVNYLDDFGVAEVWDKVEEAFEELAVVIKDSGLQESVENKCPNITMVFQRIWFDTENFTLSVIEERC